MPVQHGVSVDNNFTGGLVTEASGMNFPENACTDALNCVFNIRGPVARRDPVDFENGYAIKAISRSNSVVASYVWRNVSGDGSVTLYVVQVGSALYFYRTVAGSISAGVFSGSIDLTTYKPSAAPSPAINECQFSSALGKLFVTHPTLEPFYVVCDTLLNTVTATQITVQIRDTVGDTADVLGITGTSAAIEKHHQYNLQNQGWYTFARATSYRTAAGVYPSNADVWWLFKNTSDQYDTAQIPHVERGSTQAPQGHYILSAFNQDRSTASGVAGISTVTTSYNRPATSAFFAGRIFYAGTGYSGWESKVLFSQIVEDVTQAGYCYQKNDPTSETLFALDAADGGYFSIPNAGLVHKLVTYGQYLVVFAANGVWAVSGPQDIGYTANSYKIEQISLIGAISAKSFVDVNGLPMYWGVDGIYALQPTQNGLTIQNITLQKIRSFYRDIPIQAKLYARGTFDTVNNIVHWLYKSEEAGSLDTIYEFDSVLTFNTQIGAFSPWEFGDGGVKVHSIFLTSALRSVASEGTVINEAAATVVDELGATVTVLETVSSLDEVVVKYVVSYSSSGTQFTIAQPNSSRATFEDWGALLATDYSSYFVTGYRLRTQGARPFKSHYLFTFNDVTEADNNYTVRSIWDFSNTENARWSRAQTVLAEQSEEEDVVRRRLLIRGHGVAVQFKFESIAGEDFNIVGWSVYDSANQDI